MWRCLSLRRGEQDDGATLACLEVVEGRLSEEGSLAAVDADDGLAAQEPGWIRAGGEDF